MVVTKPEKTENEVLSGLIERVTFHNEDNGFCVLKIKARGHRDLVPLVGHSPTVSAGEWINATGIWENKASYGLQFKANFMQVTSPNTIEGIEKYLGSGLIYGIGPVYAGRLVKRFREDVFDIIEESPEKLLEVEGIGEKRAKKITAGWSDQKIIRQVMIFLHQHGVSTARSVRIYKTYGTKAIEVMNKNPYQLATDIRGIGFKTADTIAQKLGIEKTAMTRVCAGISYALMETTNNGHCCYPREDLTKLAEELLEVPIESINQAVDLELANGSIVSELVQDKECLFLKTIFNAERGIAEQLKRIVKGKLPWPEIDIDRAIPWVEKETGLQLAESQSNAIRLVLSSKAGIITGGPGVGKTTIVNSIIKILRVKNLKILQCAPTGRAAKRMTEATGIEAKTIHRLLEFSPIEYEFKRNEENPLKCDLIVIDESSMVDVYIMNSLLKAIPSDAAILIIGDIDQLPSVGPGQVLTDLINSKLIPVVRLTEVFRQAATSKIITNAHMINLGRTPNLKADKNISDFYFIKAETSEEAVELIVELAKKRIPRRFSFDPIKDIQILCPMNRGGIGAQSLNIRLQEELNPETENKVEKYGWKFAVKDKVMQTSNDYDKDIYNGDIGMIEKINQIDGEISINFDGRSVIFPFGELDTIVPAYATTIHKSQGSEYPAVIIPIMTQHFIMLQRNLIYTGVTRGKKLVVLVGQEKAVYIAVKKASDLVRLTNLKQRLIA